MSRAKLPKGIDQPIPDGKYRARVHIGPGANGRPLYKSRSFTKLRDAEKWREDTLRAKETGRVTQVDADMQTLRALATEHMTAVRPDLETRTFENYAGQWARNVLTHPIANAPLRAVDVEAVETFRDDLRAAGVGEQSIRKTLALMQTIMQRAVRFRRIAFNPVKEVKKPKAKRSKTVRPVAPDAVEGIRANLKGAHAVFVSVLAYSGMRPGEARALLWGDIGARTIRVERSVDPDGSGKATKTAKPRSVRLLAPLADDLKAWRKASGNPSDAALVFPRAGGGAWTEGDYKNFRARTFKRAAKDAGVDIGSPYDLRHSAASLWLHEGINAVQVAAWMGNSPAILQGTYAHVIADLDPDDRASAVDIIRRARRDRDIPVTWNRVQASPTAVKRSAA